VPPHFTSPSSGCAPISKTRSFLFAIGPALSSWPVQQARPTAPARDHCSSTHALSGIVSHPRRLGGAHPLTPTHAHAGGVAAQQPPYRRCPHDLPSCGRGGRTTTGWSRRPFLDGLCKHNLGGALESESTGAQWIALASAPTLTDQRPLRSDADRSGCSQRAAHRNAL